MKKTRDQVRKELNAEVAMFLSLGNQITKIEAKQRKPKQSKEQVVEIEIDYLPAALRVKHFNEA